MINIRILILLFVAFSSHTVAQSTPLKYKKFDPSYTWRTKSSTEIENYYMDLPTVEHSNYSTHIRISLRNQIIDLNSTNNKTFKGILIHVIREYDSSNNQMSKINQYIYQKIEIDDSLSTKIAQTIIHTGQSQALTDSLITGWNHLYLHGDEVNFQFKVDNEYKKQQYYCAGLQDDTIKVAKAVVSITKLLEQMLALSDSYQAFMSLLPPNKVYSDGYRMIHIVEPKTLR